MGVFLRIAWRNVLRNRKRSAITISAVTVGLGGLVFLWGFVDGAHRQMVENFTDFLPGHIQVHRPEFQLKKSLSLLIPDSGPVEKAITATPDVKAYSKRIETVGMASTSEALASVMVIAIDPEMERKVTKVEKIIEKGRPLTSADEHEIVIGADLARKLEAGVGDKVVLIAETVQASLSGEAFRVAGIFRSGSEQMDAYVVYVLLPVFQRIVEAGDGVTNFVIKGVDLSHLPELASQIRNSLSGNYEVLTWREISPMTAQWIEFDNVFIFIIVLIVLVIVAAGILNTLLMSIMERLREFGVMLSLGTKGVQVGLIVMIESLCLSVVGMALGILIGIAVTQYFHYAGIDLSRFTRAFGYFYIGSVVYPVLSFRHLALSTFVILFSSVIVSLYPAWRVLRLEPVEAMNRT